MYLERNIDTDLINWRNETERKPLLVRGARQVGKSSSIRKLGESFDSFLEVNFEEHKRVHSLFEGDLTPENFIVPAGCSAFDLLHEKLRSALIVAGVTVGKSRFLWELMLPSPGGNRRTNQWAETRLKCAQVAQSEWVRTESDTDSGGYNYVSPIATIPDPDWDGVDFQELVRTAYADRIIQNEDHEVVKEYLGG